MSFQRIDLTTALRPTLLPDETLLFVQDAVGLYEGYVLGSDSTMGSLLLVDQSVHSVPVKWVLGLTFVCSLTGNTRFQVAKTDMRT